MSGLLISAILFSIPPNKSNDLDPSLIPVFFLSSLSFKAHFNVLLIDE